MITPDVDGRVSRDHLLEAVESGLHVELCATATIDLRGIRWALEQFRSLTLAGYYTAKTSFVNWTELNGLEALVALEIMGPSPGVDLTSMRNLRQVSGSGTALLRSAFAHRSLEQIYVSAGRVTKAPPIAASLTAIGLEVKGIDALDFLERPERLEYVGIGSDGVLDVSALEQAQGLRSLHLSAPAIVGLGALARLDRLSYVRIAGARGLDTVGALLRASPDMLEIEPNYVIEDTAGLPGPQDGWYIAPWTPPGPPKRTSTARPRLIRGEDRLTYRPFVVSAVDGSDFEVLLADWELAPNWPVDERSTVADLEAHARRVLGGDIVFDSEASSMIIKQSSLDDAGDTAAALARSWWG